MGHDQEETIVPKLMQATFYGGAFGTIVGFYDVLFRTTNPITGIMPSIYRIAYFAGPMIGMSTAYVSVLHIANNVTKKDTYFNYFIAGAIPGGILGAWTKNPRIGSLSAIAFGVAAMLKKTSIDEGWQFINNPPTEFLRVGRYPTDLTLYEKRPGNWTRGE